MDLLKRKQKLQENASKSIERCKHCTMQFKDKERLRTHQRIAHSGRGERKKDTSQPH